MRKADFPEGFALVAGGSGGVGRAICVALAEAGADVVLTYHGNQAAGEETAELVRATGRKGEAHKLDLRDASAVEALLAELCTRFGNLHSVVNAVGADIPMRYISQIDAETWASVLQNDANGFFNLLKASLPHLREHGGGSITTLGSAGLRRFPVRDVLSVAPKMAIEALIQGVAKEEGRFNVRANSVAIGVVEAGIFLRLQADDDIDQRWLDAARANTPMRRFGQAEEVADAVVFLASARASYITGQMLMADGGYTI